MPLYLKQNGILLREGFALASHSDCCCGSISCGVFQDCVRPGGVHRDVEITFNGINTLGPCDRAPNCEDLDGVHIIDGSDLFYSTGTFGGGTRTFCRYQTSIITASPIIATEICTAINHHVNLRTDIYIEYTTATGALLLFQMQVEILGGGFFQVWRYLDNTATGLADFASFCAGSSIAVPFLSILSDPDACNGAGATCHVQLL